MTKNKSIIVSGVVIASILMHILSKQEVGSCMVVVSQSLSLDTE